MEILENIQLELDIGEIKRRLRMKEGRGWEQVQGLIEEARPLINSRAVYKVSYIDAKEENAVTVDGTRFNSQVLRKNLDNVERVFPYVVTIGEELEASARTRQDMLERYYLDSVANVALVATRKHLEDQLRSKYALGGVSFMSPGSLADWPIEEQRPLFTILGDVDAAIGVKLSESLLMIPNKSLSGMYFPTETRFFNCQLCPREQCPGRKAKYSEKMAKEYGILE